MRRLTAATPNLCLVKTKKSTLRGAGLQPAISPGPLTVPRQGNIKVIFAKQSQFFLKLKKQRHIHPP
jgi:hypothetical protein